jgi:hypothetical protein
MMLASTLDSAHAACPVRLRAYTSMKGVVNDRPPGSYPKTGVMSGLATILPEPAIRPSTRLDECVGLISPFERASLRYRRGFGSH